MTEAVPVMVGSIVVVGVLTCTMLHSMCNLKATQMNMQHNLIQELMLYKFQLGCIGAEATKNTCCVKSEGTVNHSTVTRNFAQVERTAMIKQGQVGLKLDSDAVFQAIKTNSESIGWTQHLTAQCG